MSDRADDELERQADQRCVELTGKTVDQLTPDELRNLIELISGVPAETLALNLENILRMEADIEELTGRPVPDEMFEEDER